MSEKCIFDNFGGKGHPYNYCIKPLSEMIDYDNLKGAGSLNMKALETYAAGGINYATSLVLNPSRAISRDCLYKVGNKYLLKTESQCSDGNTLHKYIDNMDYFNIITGRTSKGDDGIIPAAVSSAAKINAMGLLNALTGPVRPNCVKVKVPCHVVGGEGKQDENYFGTSPEVYISVDEYNDLRNEGKSIELVSGDPNQESFQNINKKKPNNKDNIYYIIIAILLFIITYKLLVKKIKKL